MRDKKHIDRIFQEKFKNFEATPDDAVWENIHNSLHENKRKRRVIPLWWFAGGAAAVLFVFFTMGTFFNNDRLNNPQIQTVDTETTRGASEPTRAKDIENSDSNNVKNNNLVNTQPSESNSDNYTDEDRRETIANPKTATQIAHESARKNISKQANADEDTVSIQQDKLMTPSKEETVANKTPNLPESYPDQNVKEPQPLKNDAIWKNDNEINKRIAKADDWNKTEQTETLKENKNIITLNKEDESIEEAIAKANSTNEKEKEEQPNRWNISPNVAPVYFNSLGKGSTISDQFVNNDKSGDVNMSYGISGSYAINDKIKIRAGVNKVALGYSTDGVMAFRDINSFNSNAGNKAMRNINFINQGESDSYISTSHINYKSAPQFMASNVNGALEQKLGYIEVPLEMEYSIIDRKFGLNVIGGFSTLFLNNNAVYSVMDNQKLLIGEANNVNSTSYSANFGLGMNYNLSHTLKWNLEPMFKYQLNTFTNTSGDFRPYFIGVYTGFSFKF